MNRRIPIGTYGGVGGRRLITGSYLIVNQINLCYLDMQLAK